MGVDEEPFLFCDLGEGGSFFKPDRFPKPVRFKKNIAMQRYVEQLINDIRNASWKIRPPHQIWYDSEADPDIEPELDDISYVENYVYGQEEPVSGITGIDASLLPPADKLTDEQKAIISVELEKLLDIFHFKLDFPESYSHHLRYRFIREFWSKKYVPLSFGTSHIEFCDYQKDQCPFPGHCKTCDEVEEQMKYDEPPPGAKLPDFDIQPEDLLPTAEEIERWLKEREDKDFNQT